MQHVQVYTLGYIILLHHPCDLSLLTSWYVIIQCHVKGGVRNLTSL